MTWTSNDSMNADRISAAAARRAGQPEAASEVPTLLARLDAALDAAWGRSLRLMPLGDLRLRQVAHNVKDLAGHAHPARAAHLLREAVAIMEAYTDAPDLVVRNSFLTGPTGGIDVRRAVEVYHNPTPTPAPVPFGAAAWLRSWIGAGWSFRVDVATGAVLAKPPAPPHRAATPVHVDSVKLILRRHAAELAAALATPARDEGFTVGAAA